MAVLSCLQNQIYLRYCFKKTLLGAVVASNLFIHIILFLAEIVNTGINNVLVGISPLEIAVNSPKAESVRIFIGNYHHDYSLLKHSARSAFIGPKSGGGGYIHLMN